MKIVLTLYFGLGGILALVDLIRIIVDKYEVNPDKLFSLDSVRAIIPAVLTVLFYVFLFCDIYHIRDSNSHIIKMKSEKS